MSDKQSCLICTNPICELYNKSVDKEESVLGQMNENCCPKCYQPLIDESTLKKQKDALKKQKVKKLIFIGAGIFAILLIVGTVFFFVWKKDQGKKGDIALTGDTVGAKKESNKKTDIIVPDTTIIESTPQPKSNIQPTQRPSDKANQTEIFSNGDKYIGQRTNGIMNGLGTYYYAKRQLISKKDLKKRFAEAGDYIIGEWYEGNLVQGKLFASDGHQKESIIIGR